MPVRPRGPGEKLTDDEWRYWSCERKRRFNRREAKREIALAERKYQQRLFKYRCDFGNHYHLTRNWNDT